MSIIEKAAGLLKEREFVDMATADKDGKPNSAPKLLLKTQGTALYFVDYSIGKTSENLKVNPLACLSFMDLESLSGYRLYGRVEIIEKGKLYEECLKELRQRKMQLSIERIIKGVHSSKAHDKFELEFPERFLVYKVMVDEASEITTRGEIKKEENR